MRHRDRKMTLIHHVYDKGDSLEVDRLPNEKARLVSPAPINDSTIIFVDSLIT
jgi:hypothetical protein